MLLGAVRGLQVAGRLAASLRKKAFLERQKMALSTTVITLIAQRRHFLNSLNSIQKKFTRYRGRLVCRLFAHQGKQLA